MDTPNATPAPSPIPDMFKRMSRSFTLKLLILGAALIGLLIPLLLVWEIVEERSRYSREVISEVGNSWGHAQQVAGPVLVLTGNAPKPEVVMSPTLMANGTVSAQPALTKPRPAPVEIVLPETLDVAIDLLPESRHRGLYSATVYTSALTLKGQIALPEGRAVTDPASVRLHFGVGDTRSLTKPATLLLGQREFVLEPGSLNGFGPAMRQSLVAELTLDDLPEPGKTVPFTVQLEVKGSEAVNVLPLARQSLIHIAGPWADPSFGGHVLPGGRTVTDTGFEATWELAHYGRNFGQSWLVDTPAEPSSHDVSRLTLQVTLMQPDSGYRLVERAVKYGALIIALTFTLFVLLELITGVRIRFYHYALSGLALVLFYLLLLSLSEVVGATLAYSIATIATSTQVGLFARTFTGSNKRAAITGAALAGLYAYIYVILRMDSYALLSGSLLLFVALSGVMHASRFIPQFAARQNAMASAT
ncbi:MAG: cell envelope integrity protein CreD [Alphaproteobacteria bacterium]